jgi:hypothetical protein
MPRLLATLAAWPSRIGSGGSRPARPLTGQMYVAEISMALNQDLLVNFIFLYHPDDIR